MRKANTEHSGIVSYAKHNENADHKAVQSSDPRLTQASTEKAGIIELAQDREVKEGRVVQSTDSRLQYATHNTAGIVELAEHDSIMPNKAITADDPRLSAARLPLPHKHDYAPIKHDFNSHTGSIQLKSKQGHMHKSFSALPAKHAPISASNTGDGAAIVGESNGDGVHGVGTRVGVIGL